MTPDLLENADPEIPLDDEPAIAVDDPEVAIEPTCDCIASGNQAKPKQHGADPHAKNCAIYVGQTKQVPEPEVVDVPAALMQVLPAGFPLPALTRFCPDVRLKTAAEQAAAYALSLDVRGAEGLQAADLALVALRGTLKGITEHFEEPARIADALHKSITGVRADWIRTGKDAEAVVGRRIYAENARLKALADEERRKAQAEEDRKAREEIRKRAEAAAAAQAPKAVVENLQRQAETAKAAPVAATASAPPKLSGTTITKKWTATLAGTPREEANQQPSVEEMTSAQQAVWRGILLAIVENKPGAPPLSAATPNWRAVTARAKADESTFAIPGFEAYDAGGTRSKGARSK